MIGLIKSVCTRGRAPANTSRDRAAEIYQRYGAALYTQALLMIGNERMAEQVACDVIAEEFTAPPAWLEGADAASHLSVSVLRRCQVLTADRLSDKHAATDQMPGNGASCIGWGAFLCDREREVLGLVLFGGLEYRQAARELAIPAPEAAALLRTALISLPALPAHQCGAATARSDKTHGSGRSRLCDS